MASKYPTVTAKNKQHGPKARNFPAGKSAANDNKIGPVKALPIAKIAKRFLPLPPIAKAFLLGTDIGQAIWDNWPVWDDEVTSRRRLIPPQYWQLAATCSAPNAAGFAGWRVNGACIAFNGSIPPLAAPPATSAGPLSTVHWQVSNPEIDLDDYVAKLIYTRKTGAPNPSPTVSYEVHPLVESAPMARPWAVPYGRPSPYPDIGVEPAKPRQRPKEPLVLPPVPGPVVVPWPQTGQPSVVIPRQVISLRGGRPRVRTDEKWARARPRSGSVRQRRERERKYKAEQMSATLGVIWAGVNTTTEVFDFIQAMHDSIDDPKYKLSKKASKAQVLEYMMSHFEPWKHIDLAEAIQNYVNMQVGDYVAALGSGAVKNMSRELGIVTGLDRAVNQGRNYDQDYQKWLKEQGLETGSSMSEYIPQLDIDYDTGVISIVGPAGVLDLVKWK